MIGILTGEQEQHISADIAYAVRNYWRATGDERFLREAGAEILLEIARFWASRAEHEDDGRYHIRGVIVPDEYHESVDGLRLRLLVAHGVPGAEIVRVATEQAASRIVLGWRGELSATRAVTLQAVLREAPCPTMVARV